MDTLHRWHGRHIGTMQARRAAPRVSLSLRHRSTIEPLEERHLMAADLRTFDGTFNNLRNPDWGSAGENLLRIAPAEYADGVSTPAGADRPSARLISNELVAETEETANERQLAAMVYAWGQFIDHDLDLTTTNKAEAYPVAVPQWDSYFDPTGTSSATISLSRSIYDSTTGTSASNPRQQINTISAFLDGSMIYGSDATFAASLRTGVGGRMKTSEGNLLPIDPASTPGPDAKFIAGDSRANENIELTSLQTLFVREHNRLATSFQAANRRWTDEQVFQAARRIVIAEVQVITYNEFLPALLGENALSRYRGYNPSVNPGVATEFSTAAFRLGHSMLGADVEFMDNNGQEVREELALRDAFNNPAVVKEAGIDSILKYLASDPAREIDNQINDDVRNFLFGPPGAGGLDLASLNIQRGRDHGLADYNATRVAYGLRPVTSFAQITRSADVQQKLEALYGNVNNIDLWVGGLAEDHVRGSSLGPLFQRIVANQFERLRDGDRFWYQRELTSRELAEVSRTSLADIISRNTTTTNLQENVFFFHTSISGSVMLDVNRDGRINSRDAGVPGITVQLLDLDGNLVATAVTRRDGSYTFDSVDFGTYRVQVQLPSVLRQFTRDPRPIEITRGQDVANIDFGLRLGRAVPTPAMLAAVDQAMTTSLDPTLDTKV